MDENKMIPYIAFESATSRQERTIKRLWILCIVLTIALLLAIGGLIGAFWYETQYEDVSVTQEVEATSDGDSDLRLNTVGGDYNGGESKSEADN